MLFNIGCLNSDSDCPWVVQQDALSCWVLWQWQYTSECQAYQQQICCTVLENKPATEDKWGRWPALMRRLGWCETRRKAVWRLSFGGCGVLLKGVCGGRGRGEETPNKTSTQKVISFVCSFLYYYFYSKLIITLCFTATVVISLWLNMYFICYSVWDVAHAEMCKTNVTVALWILLCHPCLASTDVGVGPAVTLGGDLYRGPVPVSFTHKTDFLKST